jgi:hypothetical protein
MDTPNRRRSIRQPQGWVARYLVDDREDWYQCRVVDVSLGGAALELFGPAPLQDGGMLVELQPAGEYRIGLQLHGQMRDLTDGGDRGIRVGIDWAVLSNTEREQLALLLARQAGAVSS